MQSIKICAQLFLSVILFLSCVHSDNDVGARTSRQVPKRVCGHFNVSDNASFDIYDRETHNLGFAQILATDEVHEKFRSVDVKPDCELIFCFIDLFHGKQRMCDRLTNFVDLSPSKYTYTVSMSCSCKQPAAGCNNTRCENAILDEDTCVHFYKEDRCSECRFEPYKLAENVTINPTNNSFVVHSIAVKDNCTLEVKSFGTADPSSAASTYYEGAHDNIQLAYFQKYKPAEFLCRCGQIDKAITTTESSPDDPDDDMMQKMDSPSPLLSNPFLLGLIVIAVIILVLGSLSICFAYWRASTKLSQYSEEAEKRFNDGTESLNSEIADHVTFGEDTQGKSSGGSGTQKCNYVAIGYLEALKQPYLRKYEIEPENLIVDESGRLGKGNFGVVRPGKLMKPDGSKCEVAVKTAKGSTSMIYFVSLLDEIKILAYLGPHPNIVCIVGAHTTHIRQRDAVLLLELCSKGNLKTYLKENRATFVSGMQNGANGPKQNYHTWNAMTSSVQITKATFSLFLKWAREIATGMEFLSARKVVHIDLAGRNILLADDLTAKVSDFGLSRRIQNAGNYARIGDKYGLPISWMALESLRDKRFTIESDVWSFGVTLWEIFSLGNDPYTGMEMSFGELLTFLGEGKRLEKPAHASDDIYSIMLKCWTENPSERPSFTDLVQCFGECTHL